ncbi:MAG TPA: aldehyde dehydrogenase family protein, partial [Acidimicrobiales bacterium]
MGDGETAVGFSQVIGGVAGPAQDGRVLDSVDPSTGTVWATIPRGTAADVDAAVRAAHAARRDWARLGPAGRARRLRRLAELFA